MQTSRERLWPLVITALFNYLGLWLLKKMGLSGVLQIFILGTLIALFVAAVITVFWKISLHMMGIGGVTGVILALGLRYNLDITFLLGFLILASGLTGSSRLYLGAHTPAQIYVGYFLGVGVICGAVLFY